MNLVIISACDPIDQFVISQIAKSFTIRKLIRPVWCGSSQPQTLAKKLSKLTPKKVMGRLRAMAYRPLTHRMYESITEQLFGCEGFDLGIETHDIPRSQINRESTAALLRELNADVLLVSNAPILRERIFTAAKMTANLHYGIAPKYRGTHTVFWPLYYQDYENVGVTLHHIDRGTDTGTIIAQGFPNLDPSDNEASLSAKNARVAAQLATAFLAAAENGDVNGVRQSGEAKTYFYADRKLLCDLRYQFARRFLGCHPPTTEARLVKHFDLEPSSPLTQRVGDVEMANH